MAMTKNPTRTEKLAAQLKGRRADLRAIAFAAFMTTLAAVSVWALAAAVMPLPQPTVPMASRVYDASGRVAARIFVENRIVVPLSEIPRYLRDAVVAVEDHRFYRHFGVEPLGILRAAARNLTAGEVVEGGSTITQQLARNLYLSQSRTVTRKVHEMFLALSLEAHLTKDEILERYLNQIYLGHGTYGVEAASLFYFGKHVRDLDLAECALLAGVIRSPEALSPKRNPQAAVARRNLVLGLMAKYGFIDPEKAAEAKKQPLRLGRALVGQDGCSFFVQHVAEEISRQIPGLTEAELARGGYGIYTTMDLDMQLAAEAAVKEGLFFAAPDPRGVPQPQGALVAIDPANGHIKALVGGTDFEKSNWNRATKAVRQPGSAFKPFLYYAVLARGHPPTAQQVCEPVAFPGTDPSRPYMPKDFGQDYHFRPMGIREAVKISDNVVAVRWASTVGPHAIADIARKAGIRRKLDVNLTLALGTSGVTPMEMAAAYCPFANGGYRVKPVALLKLVDAKGRTLLENRPPPPEKVLDERVTYILTDIMKTVLEPGGTAGGLNAVVGRPCAGKSGTSDEYRDLWFIGYSPDLVCAVYVGNDDQQVSVGRTGGAVAAPIWASFMKRALAGKPNADFVQPTGVVRVQVCSETGLRAGSTCPSYSEVFLRGTEPVLECPRFHRDGWLKDSAPDSGHRQDSTWWQDRRNGRQVDDGSDGEDLSKAQNRRP